MISRKIIFLFMANKVKRVKFFEKKFPAKINKEVVREINNLDIPPDKSK